MEAEIDQEAKAVVEAEDESIKQLLDELDQRDSGGNPSRSSGLSNLGLDNNGEVMELVQDGTSGSQYVSLLPVDGYVIKTKHTGTESKVFVNVFHHPEIVNMIAAPVKSVQDKQGQDCDLYDVIIPDSTFTEVQGDPLYCDMISREVIELIEVMYAKSLDKDYSLPVIQKGFMGDMIEYVDVPLNVTSRKTRVMLSHAEERTKLRQSLKLERVEADGESFLAL
jgi:hypothetical protein